MLNSVLNSASVLNSPFVYDKIKTNKETNVIEIKKKTKFYRALSSRCFALLVIKPRFYIKHFLKIAIILL